MCYPAQNTTDLGAGEQPPESFQTVVSIFLKTAATPSVLETLLYLEKIQLIFLNQDGDLWEFYSWKPTPFLSHCTPPSQAPHPTSSYFFFSSIFPADAFFSAPGSCHNRKGLDLMCPCGNLRSALRVSVCVHVYVHVGRGCVGVCVCVGRRVLQTLEVGSR